MDLALGHLSEIAYSANYTFPLMEVELDPNLNWHFNRLAILHCWLELPALNCFYCLCVEVFVQRSHNRNVMRHPSTPTTGADSNSSAISKGLIDTWFVFLKDLSGNVSGLEQTARLLAG
jgi:hypothetical protein